MSKDPAKLKIAEPYARALLQIAEAEGQESTFSLIANSKTLLVIYPIVAEYLTNPAFTKKTKYSILTKLAGSKEKQNMSTIIRWLIERDRISILPTVLELFLDKALDSSFIDHYVISTAKKMPRGSRKMTVEKIHKLTDNKNIILEFKTNETLIGGFLIEHKGKVNDHTIKNTLKIIAKQLDTILKL